MSTQTQAGHGTHAPVVQEPQVYGLLAEFLTPEAVVEAARQAREAGYRQMEAYSPFPVDGLAEALGFHRNRVPLLVLIGGLSGALIAFLMQWYSAVIHYPINIGGRPYNTWPMFVVIMFELTILGGALCAVLGMLGLNGLPRPYNPIFNAPGFSAASSDRFFLCIEAADPQFDRDQTRRFLERLNPKEISEVEC